MIHESEYATTSQPRVVSLESSYKIVKLSRNEHAFVKSSYCMPNFEMLTSSAFVLGFHALRNDPAQVCETAISFIE